MSSRMHIIPIEQLVPLIEDMLRKAPRVVRELSQLTGYSEKTIRHRLEMLEFEGRAYSILRGNAMRAGGGYNEWHFGPRPSLVSHQPRHQEGISHRTIGEYDIKEHSRRDELHEALFGPAGNVK